MMIVVGLTATIGERKMLIVNALVIILMSMIVLFMLLMSIWDLIIGLRDENYFIKIKERKNNE